ncbi:MAG: hypothetical protein ABIN44_10465 [Burkholderiaceae bacterium]
MTIPADGQLITTRGEFHAALRNAFAEAAAVGCRELWLSDTDFADWPLGERAVVGHLAEWAQSQRRLVLLAENFDEVARRHPRWVEWRRQWSHIVQCRASTEAEPNQIPTLLLAGGVLSVHLSDRVRFRGRASRDPADGLRCHERIDAILQRSVAAFPATTTGL